MVGCLPSDKVCFVDKDPFRGPSMRKVDVSGTFNVNVWLSVCRPRFVPRRLGVLASAPGDADLATWVAPTASTSERAKLKLVWTKERKVDYSVHR